MKTLTINPDETQRERRDRQRLAFRFFYESAGYSYGQDETPETGRNRCAWGLVEAEQWAIERGVRFVWERDGLDSSEWSDERPPWAQYVCRAMLGNNSVASLYGIDFGRGNRPGQGPGGSYKRVVEAELASEAMEGAR